MLGLALGIQDLFSPLGKILRETLGLSTMSLSQLTRCQVFCFGLDFLLLSVVMLSHLMLIRSLAAMHLFKKERWE